MAIKANTNPDTLAVTNLFQTMKNRTRSSLSFNFGESAGNITKAAKQTIAKNLTDLVFNKDLNMAAGESSVASNAGNNALIRKNFISGLKSEMEERTKNVFSSFGERFSMNMDAKPTQQWAPYATFLPSTNQLLLMAIAPSVIKPVHNKLVKSVVTPALYVEREQKVPYIIANGKTYDYYKVINDPTLLLEINKGGQPTIRVTVPFDGKEVKAGTNVCSIYNAEQALRDPENFRAIKSATDFISKGVKITSVVIDDKEIEIDFISTGNATQSGQVNTVVADINLTLTPDSGKVADEIKLMGNLRADGTVFLASNSDKIKAVTFEFFVPAKGAQDPITVVDQRTIIKRYIEKKASAAMTLNAKLLDDVNLVLNEDLVATFNETAVKTTNSTKDNALLAYLNDQIVAGSKYKSAVSKWSNEETVLGKYAEFAYRMLDMSTFNYGFDNFVSGHNISLAKSLFDTCNDIDVKINPEQREFSMLSSSSAAQWLKSGGQDVHRFNIVGDTVSDGGTVGGFTVDFGLQRVSIADRYFANYVTTNKVLSEQVAREVVVPAGGNTKTSVMANKHRYTFIPRFEENLDSIIFYHGLERVTEGVNNTDFNLDKNLQYETQYDIMTFNKSLGVVDFVESPSNLIQ